MRRWIYEFLFVTTAIFQAEAVIRCLWKQGAIVSYCALHITTSHTHTRQRNTKTHKIASLLLTSFSHGYTIISSFLFKNHLITEWMAGILQLIYHVPTSLKTRWIYDAAFRDIHVKHLRISNIMELRCLALCVSANKMAVLLLWMSTKKFASN